jgi:hypothetical protein
MIKKILKNSEKGQAIILIAFAIIGLIAIVGLMTDSGMLLVEYARLKRGIDAAAIGAAQQFRKDFNVNDLRLASQEFLKFNQSDVITDPSDPDHIKIEICETDPTDTVLCAAPRRKLVRVTATREVTFGFMRIVGFNSTRITATSIGEAASLDIVLVIDTSASMAYQTVPDSLGDTILSDPGDPGDDPIACNQSHNCEPLESVKNVALQFVNNNLFFPYDRVAIVTMTSQNFGGFRNPEVLLSLTDNLDDSGNLTDTVQQAIDSIKVLEPQDCDTAFGVCVQRDVAGDYIRQDCPALAAHNPSSCTSSNIGGALLMAGSEFARTGFMREDSFWVVIALVGGPANATNSFGTLTDINGDNYPDDPLAFGFCPSTTWVAPFCRDALASTRHYKNIDGTFPADYDAEDYARDQADWLADPVDGNGVTVFTIGLGDLVRNAPQGDPDAGEILLQYIAENAGDTIDPITGLITVTANHGFYRYSPDTSGLAAIFAAIAENILTRISQ